MNKTTLKNVAIAVGVLLLLSLAYLKVESGEKSMADTVIWANSSGCEAYALRLRPGQDLKDELDKFAKGHNITAGYIATCAGSLDGAVIRYANQENGTPLQGKFEIVSLSGTLSSTGGSHIHIAISDSEGKTLGGHLLSGSKINTTAEIVIMNMKGINFIREQDDKTGYKELKFEK